MMVTNYTLCSEESKPNQNKDEQTSPPPIPREQQEGMQESYRAHGFQGHSMASGSGGAFNSATYHLPPSGVYDQTETQKQQSSQLIFASTQLPFPSFPSPGLESVSSMKEALLVTAAKA